MKKLMSPQQMLACEREYFRESGVCSIDVMERAAQALADAISAELKPDASLLLICGTGGNGGDGTACARLLSGRYRCAILQARPPKTPDAIENLRRARECGVEVIDRPPEDVPDAIVDALFGTGLTRCPEGAEADLIRYINDCRACGIRVYSADIPSGLDGATGRAYERCVHADRTVAFQYVKTGMALADGLDCCGETVCADVGFPDEAFQPADAYLVEPSDLRRLLPGRARNIHKNDCGHLLIIAGSFGMAGAAAMCVRAALRSGAGLVSVACPRSIVPILQTLAPQAMCVPLAESDGAISATAAATLREALRGKDAVVIGCGLSRRAAPGALEAVLRSDLPAVIDADALNLFPTNRNLLALLNARHILTPHPGEAKRLVSDLAADDPRAAVRQLTALGATALYKGAACICAAPNSEDIFISASGCCGMARGGSGDILSGILGALLAGTPNLPYACLSALASEAHGLAGELAQKKYGATAMNAADILEFLPEVFKTHAE